MKLRIKGSSLRLRVSPSEVAQLLEAGRIEETINFGFDESAKLTYALELGRNSGAMTASYASSEITILVSLLDAERWAAGQDVGLYGETETSQGVLHFAIEKDFACLDKSDQENADTFPNPRQGAVC